MYQCHSKAHLGFFNNHLDYYFLIGTAVTVVCILLTASMALFCVLVFLNFLSLLYIMYIAEFAASFSTEISNKSNHNNIFKQIYQKRIYIRILLIFSEFSRHPHKSEGKDSHPPSSAMHTPLSP